MKNIFIFLFLTILSTGYSQKPLKSDYKVNKNQVFEIKLPSNPSTGYSWKWVKGNTKIKVDSITTNYKAIKVEPGIVGSGGEEIWKFKAVSKGIYILNFEYSRSWEKNLAAETKRFIIKIR